MLLYVLFLQVSAVDVISACHFWIGCSYCCLHTFLALANAWLFGTLLLLPAEGCMTCACLAAVLLISCSDLRLDAITSMTAMVCAAGFWL